MNGDGVVGELAAERDLLPGDHDHSGVRRPSLRGDWLGRRPGHGPGWAAALQQGGLAGFERVRPGPQQLTGLRVEEQQRAAFLDIDPDPAAGEYPRGQHDVLAHGHGAVAADGPFDLEDCPSGPGAGAAVGG